MSSGIFAQIGNISVKQCKKCDQLFESFNYVIIELLIAPWATLSENASEMINKMAIMNCFILQPEKYESNISLNVQLIETNFKALEYLVW